jgi:putative Mn2+ efflux pump MntP
MRYGTRSVRTYVRAEMKFIFLCGFLNFTYSNLDMFVRQNFQCYISSLNHLFSFIFFPITLVSNIFTYLLTS